MAQEFCPQCGTARVGALRFCRKCAFDYDSLPPSDSRPAPAVETSNASQSVASAVPMPANPPSPRPAIKSRRSIAPAEIIVVLLIIAAIGGGAYVLTSRGSPDQPAGIGAVGSTSSRPPSVTYPLASATDVPDLPSFGNSTDTEPPVGEAPPTFPLGYRTTITSNDEELGHVTVLAAKKLTKLSTYEVADSGKIFAAVHVRYEATASFSYNPYDWVAHDQDNRQYEVDSFGPEPALDSGDLSAGRKTDGWFAFQVPKATKHLWADYQNSDGSLVFSVPLY
jgi:hypothetical protein